MGTHPWPWWLIAVFVASVLLVLAVVVIVIAALN